MSEPRVLTSPEDREMARRMRDWDWKLTERVDRQGTLWFCWWDKARRFQKRDADGVMRQHCPDDVVVLDVITTMDFMAWVREHQDWWIIGEWSDERYAAPVSLTDAGREALRNRHLYDMEPVNGGLVEPGWQATPAERATE